MKNTKALPKADRKIKITQNPSPDFRYVVDVFDENQELVCYCGPYDRTQAMACVDQFLPHGWQIDNVPKMILS